MAVELEMIHIVGGAGALCAGMAAIWTQSKNESKQCAKEREEHNKDRKEHLAMTLSLAEKVGKSAGAQEAIEDISQKVLREINKINCKER